MSREGANSVKTRLPGSGVKRVIGLPGCWVIGLFLFYCSLGFAEEVKQPNVSGRFYPADRGELSRAVERYILEANPADIEGDILAIISPHAGYEFSGRTAAYGYKAIRGRDYDAVIILGPSHYVDFKGAAVWPKGAFSTPLGRVAVEESLSYSLMLSSPLFTFYPKAFSREHSVEVQLPFLQTVMDNPRIVPVVLGRVDFSECQDLAAAICEVIKDKKCLLIASSDMYHGFNYQEGELKDAYTLSLVRQLNPHELYQRIQTNEAQFCGWAAVVVSMLVADNLGYKKVEILNYTNSAEVTNKKQAGEYCVGYGSAVIYKGGGMLNEKQRKRLLEIARSSIRTYLQTNKRLELNETDPVLLEHCGAFVTLHRHGQLRGCIGNLIGNQPLYLTIRDMAVEAAVNDPRFARLTEEELPEIDIEISVLSPMERIDNPDKIRMGEHGVLIKRGYRSGVFLPQVATETGWSREEFLSNLCAHKAGLKPTAWKDSSTEIYIFTAEVFSE